MSPLVLDEVEAQQLQALANSRSLPHSIVQRAQIVLACGTGGSAPLSGVTQVVL
jgi:putative transposase